MLRARHSDGTGSWPRVPGRINGGVANYLTLSVRGCARCWCRTALGAVSGAGSPSLSANAECKHKRVSGLRIRIDEGLSKEAVLTEYTLRVTQCPPCGTVIPLGAGLPAARRCLRVCLVPAELRVSAWCQLGTDASDCLYLALNGRVLRARYTEWMEAS